MAIAIREYVGESNILANDSKDVTPVTITEGDNSNLYAPKPGCLMAEIEGIHDSRITKNFTRYMPEALRRSTKRWTTPYMRPLIKFHNDQNGEIIGRIYNVEYTEKTSVEGSGGLIFTVSVPDEKVAEQVESRILETVSIGVSANDVRCSICGKPITDASGCEDHVRGELYENEVCCWDIYDIEPKELSYVIVPSDIYAKNIRTYRAGEPGKGSSIRANITEALDNNIQKTGEEPLMNLEQELAEAKKKVEELQAALDKANEALKELEELKQMKADKEEQDKKLAEIQKLLEDKTKEAEDKAKEAEEKNQALETKVQELETAKSDLEAATQEKEAAVEAGIAAKEELRTFASQTLNVFRKLSGRKELTEQEMGKRSLDSIMDAVMDLAEAAQPIRQTELELEEGKIPNPVAPKNEQPPKTEGKDDYKIVNLSEGLEKLFISATNIK